MQELMLTESDAANYRALQRLLEDRPIRRMVGHERPNSHRKGSAFKLKVLQEQNFECVDCGIVIGYGSKTIATQDHVIPYRYGGTANRHNTEYVCFNCNRKRDKNTIEVVRKRYGTIE